jgi:hypothetical protein
MNLTKSVATVGIALSLSLATIGGLAAQTSAPSAPAPSAASETGNPSIKPMNERYLVSHTSAVYAQADTSSTVIGHVHKKKHVAVTGLEGDWLQVRLPNGQVGFIPTKAAE